MKLISSHKITTSQYLSIYLVPTKHSLERCSGGGVYNYKHYCTYTPTCCINMISLKMAFIGSSMKYLLYYRTFSHKTLCLLLPP